MEYGNRTKYSLFKIIEFLRRATIKHTVVLTVATTTPTLTHIYLPMKYHRVTVPPVSPPVPSQRVSVLQPTPPQRVHKEVPLVHSKIAPKTLK